MKDHKESILVLMPRKPRENTTASAPKLSGTEVLIRATGFLFARAVLFSGIAPFGLAFLALERQMTVGSLISLAAVALGYLSFAEPAMLYYIGGSLAFWGMRFLLEKNGEIPLKSTCFAAAVCTVFFRCLQLFWTGFHLEGLVQVLLDLGLVSLGVVVFDRCRSLLQGRELFHRLPTTEEKLALCTMAAVILLSFQNIPLSFSFSLANVAGLLLIGMIGVTHGTGHGAVSGLLVGLLLGINSNLFTQLAICLPCGLLCGICRKPGQRTAAILSTLWGVPLCIYALLNREDGFYFYEVLLGAAALAFVPKKAFLPIGRFADFSPNVKNDTLSKVHVQDKLTLTADAFDTLASTFSQISDKQNRMDMQDIAELFDTAADKVCRSCPKVNDCWEKNFNATYKTMFRFLEIMERKGVLEKEDMGSYFSARCQNPDALLKELNRLFEIYKINQVWKTKLCENRELVSQQFHGVAETLRRINNELQQETSFDALASEEILCRLNHKLVEAVQVSVLRTGKGRKTVQLRLQQPPDEATLRTICGVLRQVLGTGFQLQKNPLSEATVLQLQETPTHTVAAGFAAVGKLAESGDCHHLHTLRGGKFLAILSDGMGNGHKASRESNTIVTLLEDFMEAGFDKAVAVRLINSVMVMKSASEAFATVDFCMLDLYTGEAEFIKNGAEPSYIKRKDGTETVRSNALPVGMLSQVEVETFAHKLSAGDTIVMISDGLQLRNSHEHHLHHLLDSCEPQLPVQELADRILENTLLEKGGTPDDDMTVLVLRLE